MWTSHQAFCTCDPSNVLDPVGCLGEIHGVLVVPLDPGTPRCDVTWGRARIVDRSLGGESRRDLIPGTGAEHMANFNLSG